MSDHYNESRSRVFVLAIIVLLVLIGGLYLCKSHIQKISPVAAQPQQIRPASTRFSEAGQDNADKPLQPSKTVLTSPLGRMGWHASDPNALAQQVEGFLQKAQVQPGDDIVALISPHAGYAYSGQTAAFGIKAANTKYTRVIVIGPSHQVAMQDVLSVPRLTHYQTPLGEIPVDTVFVNKLLQHTIFQDIQQAYATEHSVLIQLPLLQYCLGDFKLVPIVAGQCSPKTIRQAAEVLKSLVDKDTLVVASSDFTHYGPNYDYVPFTQNIPNELEKLDMDAYDYIAKLDSAGFIQYCDKTGATICGRVPVAILLSMLPSQAKAELLKYTTSGELTGDYTNSVSYFSIAFHGEWQKQTAVEAKTTDVGLTQEDHKNLLLLAHQTIGFYLKNGEVPTPEQLGIIITDAMKVPRAAFVTLKKNSELRGCIGDVLPRQSLYKSVIANAINAAVNDWRFSPVTPDELAKIKIEISALTVPQPVASYNQIRIGTDGVVLKKDGQSALFLPQVAPEQRWTLEEMLTQLSLKAGLPPDAWKKDANFFVFQAEVFGE
jgi:AmmeMemoRadiSam system protein B/AmmeMemoRadiSam system protein A